MLQMSLCVSNENGSGLNKIEFSLRIQVGGLGLPGMALHGAETWETVLSVLCSVLCDLHFQECCHMWFCCSGPAYGQKAEVLGTEIEPRISILGS